jgi:hypothetical protein
MVTASEGKYETSSSVIQEQQQQLTQMQAAAEQTELLRADYSKISASDQQMRLDLQEAVQKNVSLTNQIHEAVARANTESTKVGGLSATILELENNNDRLRRDLEESTTAFREMERRLDAEAEVAESASSRAESAVRARDALEGQMEDLKFAHESVLDARNRVEVDFNKAVNELEDTRRELGVVREQKSVLEKQVAEAEGSSNLAVEIEFLRSQLAQLRGQQARRDVEQEAGELAPRAILEREEQSRKMFEGIIMELRAELDRNADVHHRTVTHLEEASRKAALVDQYEQEVHMYREAAKMSAMETHSATASASEALGRTERLSHEKETTQRQLRQSDTELVAARAQVGRLKEEVQAERTSGRARHLEKLAAERRTAELVAARSRLETEADGHRQECGVLKGECALLKARLREVEATAQLASSRMAETQLERSKLADAELRLRENTKGSNSRVAQLMAELQGSQSKEATLRREYEALENTTHSLRASLDDAKVAMDGLRLEVDQGARDREQSLTQSVSLERSRAETQIKGLREDLESTVRSWRDGEQIRSDKDETIAHIRRDLAREKERGNLMKSQVGLLEERLRTSVQELSVYRSLDMYRSGMNSEMAHAAGASLGASAAARAVRDDSTYGRTSGGSVAAASRGGDGDGGGGGGGSDAAVPRRRRALDKNSLGVFPSADTHALSPAPLLAALPVDTNAQPGSGSGNGAGVGAGAGTDVARGGRDRDVKFSLQDLGGGGGEDDGVALEPERGLSGLGGAAAAARRMAEATDTDDGVRGGTRAAARWRDVKKGLHSFGIGSAGAGGGTDDAGGGGGGGGGVRPGMPSKLDFDKARRMMNGDGGGGGGGSKLSKLF